MDVLIRFSYLEDIRNGRVPCALNQARNVLNALIDVYRIARTRAIAELARSLSKIPSRSAATYSGDQETLQKSRGGGGKKMFHEHFAAGRRTLVIRTC